VGPPICSLVPPSKEIKNPATIAVINPFSGDAPLAMQAPSITAEQLLQQLFQQ